MRSLTVLGATGSIGNSCLRVVAAQPNRFRIRAVTGGQNATKLAEIACQTKAELAVIGDESKLPELRAALGNSGIQAAAGPAAICDAAKLDVDVCVAAISGLAGIQPTFAAMPHATSLVLANKETLAAAGALAMSKIAASECNLLPADSEHHALFLALGGQTGRQAMQHVQKLILTASGGPFRTANLETMRRATPEQAMAHPIWSMGSKITIDSATLFNKGLEVIEAAWLFEAKSNELDVVIHPDSIVHGLVEFKDQAMTAIMSVPDMAGALSCCMNWPERPTSPIAPLDLTAKPLIFEKPDTDKFPALKLAREALEGGGCLSLVLNAANEAAVKLFLDRKIGLLDIADLVTKEMEGDWTRPASSVEEVCEISQHVYKRCLARF